MLTITIPGTESYDEKSNSFESYDPVTLKLEHSLVSLSKWESKWKKPFLTDAEKTYEETIDYIKYMTISQNVDPSVYLRLTRENVEAVNEYIQDPMTATWFSEEKTNKKNREVITSELIYYWMVALQIPFECQKWHLNRLLTLIKVCSIKNKPPKKMSKRDAMNRQKSLNAARRAASGSNG